MVPKISYKTTEFSWQKVDDTEANDAPSQPSRLRTILSRAALVCLGLFVGLSLFMSMLGINPLIHNGAMPKCLLVYVGLAMILALANSDTNLVTEQVRSRLAIYSHHLRPEDSHEREAGHENQPLPKQSNDGKAVMVWLQRLQWAGLSVLLLTLLLTATASADLVNRKISGTMPSFGGVFGVPSAQISPDGQTVVYRAGPDIDGTVELYRAPSDGSSPPVRVNGPVAPGSYLVVYAISPDGSRVVYVAPQDAPLVNDLYSMPLGGGSSVKLNSTLPNISQVYNFKISPNGNRVVYSADQETNEMVELFVTLDQPPAPSASPIYLPIIMRE
ncbi:MAG: DPP IV N-terminal domain-containing protein [Chloroflexi bacterium]|nr:DPP IV N-terminal domain-containing protein [Chloroflexota bacterium]